MSTATLDLFPGFEALSVDAGGVHFHGVIGGSGPPVLLLHGFPETHLAWRLIAPVLAGRHTVIVPDLPGYGASVTHSTTPRWGKRRVAAALVALMEALGHSRFAVVGHDRGARAGYRLALDHPQRVSRYASLTVIPTLDALATVDAGFALANYHWFFMAQPGELPERLLTADPDGFISACLAKMAGGLDHLDPRAVAAYLEAFRRPSVRHAMCEDYRAAVNEDREQDAVDRAAGNTLACPVLVLWPDNKPSALQAWREWAADLRGAAISGGHLQPEQSSDEVLAHLEVFLH
ncbi:alpha/beta hydrolase [Pseudomonas sp. dw_358]|uniref:alpha/beta fold hydrolase n=1 Tax=Pseudomonas sp. dw_358 TaxID=2720083 RepID=UPI001BD5BC30|nr:alpha/beta hydrolase [Pseudomonas sp. dw_358]